MSFPSVAPSFYAIPTFANNNILAYLPPSSFDVSSTPPQTLVSPQKLMSDVDVEIRNYFSANRQSEKQLHDKQQIVRELKEIFQQNRVCDDYEVDLRMFGSTLTGLALADSDLDVAVRLPGRPFLSDTEVQLFLNKLNLALQYSNGRFGSVILIGHARQPIVKCRHLATDIQCDIGFMCGGGIVSLPTTALIRCYCRCDVELDRVIPLIVLVKRWAKCVGLHDSRLRLGSYALELMTINYLQVCDPAVLPVLSEVLPSHLFSAESLALAGSAVEDELDSLLMSDWKPPSNYVLKGNVDPVAKLFIGFISHYATLDLERCTISVLTGRVVARQKDFTNVYIEEPVTKSNVALGMKRQDSYWLLKAALLDAHRALRDPIVAADYIRGILAGSLRPMYPLQQPVTALITYYPTTG